MPKVLHALRTEGILDMFSSEYHSYKYPTQNSATTSCLPWVLSVSWGQPSKGTAALA